MLTDRGEGGKICHNLADVICERSHRTLLVFSLKQEIGIFNLRTLMWLSDLDCPYCIFSSTGFLVRVL